jgi:hypothetical protein
MKIALEIFLTKIVDDNIQYHRIVVGITNQSGNPDPLVLDTVKQYCELMTALEQNKVISHSTSWHYENPDQCVLTYVVYSDLINFNSDGVTILPVDNVEVVEAEDSTHPRPKDLNETHVISHGLKHISFLIKEDSDKYSQVLNDHSIAMLLHLNGVLAGKLFIQKQLSGLG